MISGAIFWCSNSKGHGFLVISCPKIVAVCMRTRWVDIKTKTIRNDCFDNSAPFDRVELGFVVVTCTKRNRLEARLLCLAAQ
jgi:hypothetical protein